MKNIKNKQWIIIAVAVLVGVIIGVVAMALLGVFGEKPENDAGNNNLIAPTEAFIISCLQKVPGITEIAAATEDNDPNGQMNKPRGYTAHVYFAYELVDQNELHGDDVIAKGTDAGGSIEVYTTEADANARNDYLASFDGSVLSSGSHTVIGSVVVRTSDELTATQQKLLETNILAALKGEDDKIVPHTPNAGNNNGGTNNNNTNNNNTNNNNNNNNNNNSNNNNNNNTGNNTDAMRNALSDAEAWAMEFATEYPNDYFTPNYLNEHLQYVLGYSETVANYAVANANINWKNHANKYAQVYLTYVEEFGRHASWWTASDIEGMLLEDGFQRDVVEATMSAIDWTAQSKKYVQHLSDFYDTFNRPDARYSLADIVANDSDMDYLLENSGVDWKIHALNMANELWSEYIVQEYYQDQPIAYIQADIVDELLSVWEYTESEVDYAIMNMTTGGISYDDPKYLEYTLNGSTYTVTGIGSFEGKNLTIPSTYEGKKVTAIGEFAFWECSSLQSVTIGSNITEIGTYAFAECNNLKTVTIPNSVTTVGEYVFYRCYELTTVNISSSSNLRAIGRSMFHGCEELTTVTIPNNVTRIEDYAFYGCHSLTVINIPSKVTYIGEESFYSQGLKSIKIPVSVQEIERAAFCNCTALTTFQYAGTTTQWNDVSKGSQWASYSAFSDVECSNGTVPTK